MILQALKEYYDRKAVDPDSDIAPIGWEYKAIPFIVVLNSFGNLVQIEDTRESEGTKKKAKVFCVPRSENKTSNIKANLLWEKAEYIFAGIDAQKDEKRLQQEREAFSSRLENQLGEFKHIQVLLSFLKEVKSERLAQEACWGEIKEKNPYLTFRFHDEMTPLFLRPDILKKINEIKSNQLTGVANGNKTGVCLITGEPCVISRTHSKTFINRKNNSLVSFQKDSGYDSYGKKQGFNAPISKTSEFAYVTALNTLLKSPRQRFFIGDGTYVCWSADKTNFETEFAMIFDDPIAQDNPDLYSEKVKALLNSIKTGAFQADEGFQRFYVLGLSPGGGTRISVRFWDSRTISEYATNIQRYFDDLSIDKPKKYPKYFALNRLLVSVAQQGDKEKLPPKLAGEVVRSIICGIPYPESLLQASLRRIQSGIKKRLRDGRQITERVTPEIAALLKAYLNRYYQFYPIKDYREVYMSLDTNHTSIGYNLGRLFATLEHVQVKANPKINTTIRDRYFGAACTTPVTVFATLLRLKNHHLTKLNRGQFIFFEKLLNEIMEKISEFPPYLNLHEQGLFAIGYYHQRNKFFSNN